HAIRGLGGPRAAVDDPAPRPGSPERWRPRAEARQRPLPPAHEPRGSARRSRPVMDYLSRLASCATDLTLGSLPSSTVAGAKLGLPAATGAWVAGSAQPENVRLAALAARRSPHGLSTLLGHGLKSDSLLATFANAAAGVALEMDEGNRLGGGHPAIHVIPAALAVAGELELGGARAPAGGGAGVEDGRPVRGGTRWRAP